MQTTIYGKQFSKLKIVGQVLNLLNNENMGQGVTRLMSLIFEKVC